MVSSNDELELFDQALLPLPLPLLLEDGSVMAMQKNERLCGLWLIFGLDSFESTWSRKTGTSCAHF